MQPAGPSKPNGGGCLCGAVRFSVCRRPLWERVLCHCLNPRRATGSPVAAFRWICRRWPALQRWREATFQLVVRGGAQLLRQLRNAVVLTVQPGGRVRFIFIPSNLLTIQRHIPRPSTCTGPKSSRGLASWTRYPSTTTPAFPQTPRLSAYRGRCCTRTSRPTAKFSARDRRCDTRQLSTDFGCDRHVGTGHQGCAAGMANAYFESLISKVTHCPRWPAKLRPWFRLASLGYVYLLLLVLCAHRTHCGRWL